MDFSKKRILIYLIIIGLISLGFKLYFVNFSVPLIGDEMNFALRGIAYSNGDFAVNAKQNPGWPLFIAPFFLLIDSNDFIDYSNVVRVLSMSITTITILPIYLLGRKFFDQKYSLVAASLFAFEPHLNRWSTFGYSEPLYILVIVLSFYLILNKNDKYTFISFFLAAILWWVRLNGIVMFVVLSIIFFVNFKGRPNLTKKYLGCIAIFLIVVSPILIQRYVQYDDPFYFYYGQNLFVDEYSQLGIHDEINDDATVGGYIEHYGFLQFFQRFIILGIYNVLEGIARIAFPYLIILLPFGLIFSLRAFAQDSKYTRANWILIIVTLASMVVPYALIPEKRLLFFIYPFLIIFATIPIQRVTEYGLSTFSFTTKQKNVFLVIIIATVVLLSLLFSLRYEIIDTIKEQEKMAFAKFLINNIDGGLLDAGYNTQYLIHQSLNDPPGAFKNFKIDRDPTPSAGWPYDQANSLLVKSYGKSLEELLYNGEERGLKYIAINEEKISFFEYLEDVYKHEEKYPYLIKIFDSDKYGFQKFKVKIFEIDYNEFHKEK